MNRIIIPARLEDTEFTEDKRKLLIRTLDLIPYSYKRITRVVTDSEAVASEVGLHSVSAAITRHTPKCTSCDLRKQLWGLCETLPVNYTITILFPNYPKRTWRDVLKIWAYWRKTKNIESLLCRKKPKTHPWNCIANLDSWNGADQLIGLLSGKKHDITREEEYPSVWEISHFVSMFTCKSIQSLNSKLYNDKTKFYPLENKKGNNKLVEPYDWR